MEKAYALSDALPQVALPCSLLFALLCPALPYPVLVWSTLPDPALHCFGFYCNGLIVLSESAARVCKRKRLEGGLCAFSIRIGLESN